MNLEIQFNISRQACDNAKTQKCVLNVWEICLSHDLFEQKKKRM